MNRLLEKNVEMIDERKKKDILCPIRGYVVRDNWWSIQIESIGHFDQFQSVVNVHE